MSGPLLNDQTFFLSVSSCHLVVPSLDVIFLQRRLSRSFIEPNNEVIDLVFKV